MLITVPLTIWSTLYLMESTPWTQAMSKPVSIATRSPIQRLPPLKVVPRTAPKAAVSIIPSMAMLMTPERSHMTPLKAAKVRGTARTRVLWSMASRLRLLPAAAQMRKAPTKLRSARPRARLARRGARYAQTAMAKAKRARTTKPGRDGMTQGATRAAAPWPPAIRKVVTTPSGTTRMNRTAMARATKTDATTGPQRLGSTTGAASSRRSAETGPTGCSWRIRDPPSSTSLVRSRGSRRSRCSCAPPPPGEDLLGPLGGWLQAVDLPDQSLGRDEDDDQRLNDGDDVNGNAGRRLHPGGPAPEETEEKRGGHHACRVALAQEGQRDGVEAVPG